MSLQGGRLNRFIVHQVLAQDEC